LCRDMGLHSEVSFLNDLYSENDDEYVT